MPITEAQYRASVKYKKKNIVNYSFQLNLKKDKDLIDFLDKIENKTQFIKDLIRKAKK